MAEIKDTADSKTPASQGSSAFEGMSDFLTYAKALGQNQDLIKNDYEDSITKHASEMRDAYNNSVLGIGASDHIEQFSDYTFENSTLNWFLWLALYNESWVFRRVIDKPSQDMIRPSVSLQGTQNFTDVYKMLDSLKPDLINALKWSRLFGGSIMVLLFKGVSFDDMEKPISWKKIEGAKYIRAYVTDRWFGCSPSYDDIVSNIANDDFGKPKYYTVQFSDGTSHRIHHSWILRFENRTAPNLIKTGQLQGWGYAEGSHLLHELSRDEKLKNSIQSLVDKSLIEVIHMPGMRGVFMGADKGNEAQLKKRLEMVNWARNFNSLTFLDKDDQYEQHQFSGISGLSEILQQNMWQIAAACEMQGVLFGDLSNGFSNDNEALERYDEKILNDDETYLRGPMFKLLRILYHVYNIRDEKGRTAVPSFSFNSIIADKKNQAKMSEFKSLLDLCTELVKQNLMTAEQEASTLQQYLDSGSVNLQLNQPSKKVERAIEEMTSEENPGAEDEDFGEYDIGGNDLMKRESTSSVGNTSQSGNEPSEATETPNEGTIENPAEEPPEENGENGGTPTRL